MFSSVFRTGYCINTNIFNNDFQEQIVESVVEQTPVEEPKSTESEIEVPEFNFDEIVKDVEEVKQNNTYTKGPQIFSSVYVPEKKEETIELKEEIKVEEPVEEKIELVKPAVDEELDFELPTLKKEEVKEEPKFEEKIEMPVLNDYNLDELSGETYTINK